MLLLREWNPDQSGAPGWDGYTGRTLIRVVTYISAGGTWGLPADLCVMSVAAECEF